MIRKQIPFPAFTVCDTGNLTYEDSKIEVAWLQRFEFPFDLVETELGLCRIVNFCKRNDLLRGEIDGNRTFTYVPAMFDDAHLENQTQPSMTASLELGFDAKIYALENRRLINRQHKNRSPFILIIHSPYELPSSENQKFNAVLMDYDTFFVTPQLTTIDDTMIAMKPHE